MTRLTRRKGLHRVGTTEHQRAIRNCDDAVSLMIRARDAQLPCILFEANGCNPRNDRECGHFIQRDRHATRFHPMNLNSECAACNSSHASGFRPDKGFPYGLAINAKYGEGTAKFLYRLANPLHEKNAIPKDDSFTTDELNLLKDAARKGHRIYEAAYFSIRPEHKPKS